MATPTPQPSPPPRADRPEARPEWQQEYLQTNIFPRAEALALDSTRLWIHANVMGVAPENLLSVVQNFIQAKQDAAAKEAAPTISKQAPVIAK